MPPLCGLKRWTDNSASLSTPGACPGGIYITPSAETLLIWEGVMFIHDGPYADAVLRFTINFEIDFPKSRPIFKFGPDVYHRELIS